MVALLAQTGQTRPLYVSATVFVGGFACATATPVLLAYQYPIPALVLFVAGAVSMLGSAWFAVRTIACPVCGLRWLEHAVGWRPMGNWVHWLVTFEECPQCLETAAGHQSVRGGHLTARSSGPSCD